LAVLLCVSLRATEVVATLSGDGTLLSDTFLPMWLAIDPQGDVFAVAGAGSLLLDVQHGTNTAVVLAGSLTKSKSGSTGDGGLVTKATFTVLGGLAADSVGNLFVLDGTRLRRIDHATAIITTIAGGATAGFGGDGGPAAAALLNPVCPYSGLAIDAANNIYFADSSNFRIRRIDATTGVITTIAGTGKEGTVAEGMPAVQSPLDSVGAVAVDGSGNVFFAEPSGVNRVFKIDAATHTVATVAGQGVAAQGAAVSPRGGPATSAVLVAPFGLAIDPSGNLIIADSGDERVRVVDRTTQIINTVVGGGTVAADGCLPLSATIFYPWGVAYDKSGNLYVADLFGFRIRDVIDSSQTDFEDTDGDGFSDVIEIAAGSNPNDASSTPFSPHGAANAAIEHCTLTAAFNVANANKVKLQIKGMLPVSGTPVFANQKLLCAFGGMTREYTLNAKGMAHTGGDTVRGTFSSKKALINFQATIGAADFSQILATGPIFTVPANGRKGVALYILAQNTIFAADVDLSFALSGNNTVRVKGIGADFGFIAGRH
jgi:sugar lactone lactonase YvrE